MPLPMVHLSVAKKIIDAGFNANRLSQFFLGSIAPDAIHIRKDADRLAKNDTHLIPKGEKWIDVNEDDYFSFMVNYIDKNKDKADYDFLWGYGIHILTDMYWSKSVYLEFVEKFNKDTAPVQEERWAYYNDTDVLDLLLYNECNWRIDVWLCLQNAEYSDFINLLSAQEIRQWNERTLHWYDSDASKHTNPIKYIMQSDIEDFITSCSETIWCKNKSLTRQTVGVSWSEKPAIL